MFGILPTILHAIGRFIHTYLFRRTSRVVVDIQKKVQGERFRRHTHRMDAS
jgi:hypothetical protein